MASPSQTFDAFLSFRGKDTRSGFVSHLWEALEKRKIRTYMDSKNLPKGERIDKLMKAIEESRFAVIIFSKEYATSAWCLNELVKIMERHKSERLAALPVFYKVQPGVVKDSKQVCQKTFHKKKEKCKNDEGIVETWNKALQDAGRLSGWVFSDGVTAESAEGESSQSENREYKVTAESAEGESSQSENREYKDEAELKNSIVDDIWKRLKRMPLHVAMHTVGIDSQLEKLKSELSMKSQDLVQGESLMIGLWAMGGMGKTTLAKTLYNSIFQEFTSYAFLESMDQTPKDPMVSWQKKMLSQIFYSEEAVNNCSEGKNLIQTRLGGTKVLLILDGVETLNQITDLAGHGNWFGNGSKIIITTRNETLLKAVGAHIYEVKALENRDAVELFKKCVSKDTSINITSDQEKTVLNHTQCLPLALEKLAYAFRANSDWEGALKAFARRCHPDIRVELEKSYNELDSPACKDIFLHIACLFNGWIRNYVVGVLGSCYDSHDDRYVAKTVDDLIRRSLIMDKNGTLQVHVLVELMARDIVDDACHKNSVERSRIWRPKDLEDALLRDKERNAEVKAIVVDLKEPERININPDGFANLKMLEFLILINVDTDFQGSIGLPNELRWFQWHGCRASGVKFTSTPRNLRMVFGSIPRNMDYQSEPQLPQFLRQ